MRNLQLHLISALRKILKMVFVKRQVLVIILLFSVSMFVNAQPAGSNPEIMQEGPLEKQEDDISSEPQLQKRMKKSDIYFFRVRGKLLLTKNKYICLAERKKTPMLSFSDKERE
jgi:hypothetical protein